MHDQRTTETKGDFAASPNRIADAGKLAGRVAAACVATRQADPDRRDGGRGIFSLGSMKLAHTVEQPVAPDLSEIPGNPSHWQQIGAGVAILCALLVAVTGGRPVAWLVAQIVEALS